MKSTYLLFFSFVQLVLFSCSEQGVYVNNVSNQVIQKDIAITRAISNLTPNCSLLIEIDENAQDTVLERLKLNIARDWYNHRKGLSLPLIDSTIKFVPVIDTPSLPSITDSDKILMPQKDFASFYGQNEKGETLYFYALYTDRSNFTKETNPRMYRDQVEMFGQEYADRVIEKLRNAKGPERWEIIVVSPQDPGHKEFEYAREHSDDGSFFILTRGRTYPRVCFFVNNKPYYCCEMQQHELGMRPLEDYLRR